MHLIQKRGACPVGNVYCIAALGHHPAGQCARPGPEHRDALPLQPQREPDHVFGGEHHPRHHRARLDLLLLREHRRGFSNASDDLAQYFDAKTGRSTGNQVSVIAVQTAPQLYNTPGVVASFAALLRNIGYAGGMPPG